LPIDPVSHLAAGPPVRRVSSTAVEHDPHLSPDGQKLAYISGRTGKMALWVVNADGSNPRQLSDLDVYLSGHPRWSPDGRRVAFHTSSADQGRVIYTVDAEGGMPQRLTEGCCPSGWSADGAYIYVTDIANFSTVTRVRLSDGRREPLFHGDIAAETPDGLLLLYVKSDAVGVFARSLAGNPAQNPEMRLVDDYSPTHGAVVPVANGFFYLGFTADGLPRSFRFYDLTKGTAKDIAPAPASIGLGMTVSPDGRWLLYSANDTESNSDLMLIEFDKT
jgi:Tol biopolymer transport system component